MANETLSTQLAGLIQDIQSEVIYRFNALCGVKDVVRWKDTTGKPGTTADFPVYSQVESSDVEEVSEGSAPSAYTQVTNSAITATYDEHVVYGFLSDKAANNADSDAVEEITSLFVNGIMAKLEDDVVSLFSGFSNTVAGAGTAMTMAHWWSAIRQLKSNGADMRRIAGVISPKQYYDAKGLRALLDDSNNNTDQLSGEFYKKGFVDNPFGMKLLVSNEINEDVSSGGDAAGGIFQVGALGVHWKGINIEMQRSAKQRGFELVCTGNWKEVELVDDWGVYFLSDVS